jgi:hypothetical protein
MNPARAALLGKLLQGLLLGLLLFVALTNLLLLTAGARIFRYQGF